jgi:UDP:flavonoid glycosyltransferase YjiC (YdhE family)
LVLVSNALILNREASVPPFFTPIVVPFAPQLELLAKASLTITHAGMNTALETLAYAVPAVAIPVGNDQPGVAARLKWSGARAFLPLSPRGACMRLYCACSTTRAMARARANCSAAFKPAAD